MVMKDSALFFGGGGGRGNLMVNPFSKPSAVSLADNCHSHIIIILCAKTGVCFDESKRTCASS